MEINQIESKGRSDLKNQANQTRIQQDYNYV